MNRLFLLLAMAGLLAMPARATTEKLAPGEIVPRFYLLLTQTAPPTPADEQTFFGTEGLNGALRTLLLDRHEAEPPTPIWTFLRRHRDLFLTHHLSSTQIYPTLPGVEISDPFRLYQPARKTYRPERYVTVTFPGDKVSQSEFRGIDTVLFVLGKDACLDIGATVLSRAHAAILFDVVSRRAYD